MDSVLNCWSYVQSVEKVITRAQEVGYELRGNFIYIVYKKPQKQTKCPYDSLKHVHVSLRSKPLEQLRFIEQKCSIILHNSNSKNIHGQVENRGIWKLN